MIWAFSIGFALLATAALAQEAVRHLCEFDTDTETLITEPAENPYQGMLVRPAGGNFVSWQVLDVDLHVLTPMRLGLQNCSSGSDLLVVVPSADTSVVDRFEQMVFGPGRHTMRQIADEMKRLGAPVRMGRGILGDCACTAAYGGG